MQQLTNDELERRFDEQGLSRRKLYPWWYRLGRLLGLQLRPPVLYTFAEHVLYVGTLSVSLLVIGGVILLRPGDLAPEVLRILVIATAMTPVLSWLRYRRIRRRIGLG